MKKGLLLLASVSLFFILFYMIERERNGKYDIHMKSESFFEGLRVIQKKNGVPAWVLTAKRADISKDGNTADLTDLQMDIKDKGIAINAGKGRYDLKTRNISIDGAVTAKSSNYSLTTEKVEIDSAKGLLRTDGPVLIEGKKFAVQGRGMEADNNEQKVRILRDVKATFNN